MTAVATAAVPTTTATTSQRREPGRRAGAPQNGQAAFPVTDG